MVKKKSSRRWPDHLSDRLRRLRGRMAEQKLDALLINCPQDIRYLTGFSGEDSWALITGRNVVILSDRRFEEELSADAPYARALMRRKSLAQELGKLVQGQRVRKVGFQAEHLTVAGRRAIVKHIAASKLRETSGWLLQLRSIKTAEELPPLRKAIDIQQRALKQTLRRIRPGMTEKRVCAMLEYAMRELGADGPSFGTIIAAGANSSIPHYRPGDVKIKSRSPILIDFGALYRGYHSDMTRVVAFDAFPRKIAEIYQIVREAQQAGIEAIRPGVPLKDVDAAARKVIQKAGYGRQFGHSLGHGIGLEIHEEPRLSWLSTGELEPGHVVTVEPGIYLPGIGGVRLEDDVLVTERSYRNLCSLPTDLESAII
jgi:Xaa-Pro aminopeptidase